MGGSPPQITITLWRAGGAGGTGGTGGAGGTGEFDPNTQGKCLIIVVYGGLTKNPG